MVVDYKNSLYTKDNLVITIAGKITDQSALEDQILSLFAPLPAKKTRQKPDFDRFLPQQQSDFFSKETEQNHLIISAPGLNGLQKEKYAASLLCTIL